MKKLILLSMLLIFSRNLFSQFVVAAPNTDGLLLSKNLTDAANRLIDLSAHATERAEDMASKTEDKAEKLSEFQSSLQNWLEQKLRDDQNLLDNAKSLEYLSAQLAKMGSIFDQVKVGADYILSLSVVPSLVLESEKLAEIFRLVDQTKTICASARQAAQNLYPITNDKIGTQQGQPIFSAGEQDDIGSVVDRYLYNIQWRLIDLSQFVVVGGASKVTMSDRFKFIGMVYDDIYKNYQDTQRYYMNLRQASRFRQLVGTNGGGATILRF